jgi:hypothetical protein
VRLVADPLTHEPDEVLGAARALEPDQVRAEEPLEELPSPRELEEELGGWEGDVEEEADPQVRAPLAQHPRHELELVVVHPDHGALGSQRRRALGEPPVDGHVGVPPLAVVLRLRDDVVVERPQRGVREPLVELLDLLGAQRDRHQPHVVLVERLVGAVRATVPADPGTLLALHHRLDSGHEAAGRPAPGVAAVVLHHPVDRKAVRHHHEVELVPARVLAHLLTLTAWVE